MASIPPDAGDEKRIFLVALRTFSEQCFPPELNASCPFAVDIGPNERGCQEECMDILREHDAPDLTEVIDLGPGLSVRRRRSSRPRRSVVGVRPFDAREMLLEDQAQPPSQWRATSLFVFLMDELAKAPRGAMSKRAERLDGILGIVAELEDRGFNMDGYMRSIGAQAVANAVGVASIVSLFGGQDPDRESPYMEDQDLDAWGQLIFDDSLTLAERRADVRNGGPKAVQEQLDRWPTRQRMIINAVASLPVSDIAAWAPPAASAIGCPPQPSGGGINLWIHTRFAKSYLADWAMGSLIKEWEYQHGRIAAPCRPQQMGCRSVPSDQLDREIAQRTAEGTQRPLPFIDANMYVGPAVEMLREGRHSSAAAVFEAVTKIAPGDAYAHNNLGFCLIPTDRDSALRALDQAARLGLGNFGPNVGNRMLILGETGRNATALSLGDRYYGIAPATPHAAFMWERVDGQYELASVPDVRIYVAELAFELADRAGDASHARLWAERVESLRRGDQPPC